MSQLADWMYRSKRLLADWLMVMKSGHVSVDRLDRSGAGRSAACLHAAFGEFGASGLKAVLVAGAGIWMFVEQR